jgi:hypothetical protein
MTVVKRSSSDRWRPRCLVDLFPLDVVEMKPISAAHGHCVLLADSLNNS